MIDNIVIGIMSVALTALIFIAAEKGSRRGLKYPKPQAFPKEDPNSAWKFFTREAERKREREWARTAKDKTTGMLKGESWVW